MVNKRVDLLSQIISMTLPNTFKFLVKNKNIDINNHLSYAYLQKQNKKKHKRKPNANFKGN